MSGNKKGKKSDVMEEPEVDLGSLLKEMKLMENRLLTHIDSKFETLEKSIHDNATLINNVKLTADDALDTANKNLTTLTSLLDRVDDLERLCANQAIQLKVLDTRQTDQTDRNSRNSLIIRGIPEQGQESWDDTRHVLCEALAPIVKIDGNKISAMIERVHRGNRRPDDTRDRPRVIHARLFNWNNVENLKQLMWKHGKDTGIYVDQRFGPNTTYRRNKALEVRRELLENHEIVGGFLRYPAKLYVKYHKDDKKYTLKDDFSKIPVPLPKQ